MDADKFWDPRPYFLDPIPEIFEAAQLLDEAVTAHNTGDKNLAASLLTKADMPIIAEWTETLWGKQTTQIHRYRTIENLPPLLAKDQRAVARMPTRDIRKKLIERDGFHCRYCGIPVIREEIRNTIRKIYPELRWALGNKNQHAAFQCMWLSYEHVLPHSRGGDNSCENMVISCQPCNCGKVQFTLEEMGLIDPRNRPIFKSPWDGLERFNKQTYSE